MQVRQLKLRLVVGGLIILSSFALAWSSFNFANGQVRAKADPVAALHYAPNNSAASAMQADVILLAPAAPKPWNRVTALSRRALVEQPLNAKALRILGYAALVHDRDREGEALMKLSARQSRRDFGAQLWYIENAVGKNDVRAALRHYDIAMRTAQANRDLLFPILLTAMDDADIQKGFAPYVRADNKWLQPFLSYAIDQTRQPVALASAFARAGGLPKGSIYRTFESRLLATLAWKGTPAQTVAYFKSLPGSPKIALTSAALDLSTTDARFSPVTWELASTPEIAAQLSDLPHKKRALSILVQPGQTGIFANKILVLPVGRYALATDQSFADDAAKASLAYEMRCRPDPSDAPILQRTVDAKTASALPPTTFSIGNNCQAQTLSIRATGGQGQQDVDMSVKRIVLTPIN